MLKKLLAASRYLVIIAVMGLFFASLALLLNGAAKIYFLIADMLGGIVGTKDAMIGFIETTDLFLLAVALYIMALGLFDLFIDSTVEMPGWLNIKDLGDLKKKLIDVVVIILAVVFLGKVMNWSGGNEILHLGAGVALVIGALTWFRRPTGNQQN
jgi:uncharacterized membrane protein YqhA